MKRYSLSRFLKWGPVLAAASVVLVAPGCDDDDPFEQGDGPAGGGGPGGTTGSGSTGMGGTTGGPGGTTGGTSGNGLSSGGTTGATSNGTTGAVDDSGWCAVKAVMDEYCVACHDGEGTAGTPMGLTSYEDLTAEAVGRPGVSVFERVRIRMHPDLAQAEGLSKMPPQGNPTAEELAAVDAWVAAGAPPAADPSCGGSSGGSEPIVDDWPPAECDEIHEFRAHQPGNPNSPLQVGGGAGARDPNFYSGITFEAPWGNEDVQAIAFRPIIGNKAVMHHWILYSGSGFGAFITGWAPGDDERSPLPDDVGMEMPSSMYLDLHYYNSEAEPQTDNSGVAVCIVKGDKLRPNPAGVTMGLSSFLFSVPIGTPTQTNVTATCDVVANNGPVTLLTASPHSHTYAVHHKFTVTKKDGTEIVMLDAPFVYGEQASYRLDPPVQIETGDKITTTCVYSGISAEDKVAEANQGRTSVGFGNRTQDEMCFNFATYYPVNGFSCGGFGGFGGGGGGGGLGGLFGF